MNVIGNLLVISHIFSNLRHTCLWNRH